MAHGRTGNAHLRRRLPLHTRLLNALLQMLEVVYLNRLCMLHLACNHQLGRGKPRLVHRGRDDLPFYLYAVEVLEVVEMEIGTAHLAVGDGADAIVEFVLDKGGDVAVFCGAEVGLGSVVFDDFVADGEDFFGAKEGSDVVGAVETFGKRHLGCVV